ncbi:MAG TPA: HAD-IIIA family hydrolase [Casimicrobiaceae bacterium]|nr:HAD-IIIA family hydrolase [Casimicrobiaceae bacterium]
MPPAELAPRRFPFIVFDWDGTLIDSTSIIADSLQQACRDLGEPVPSDVDARYVIGLGLSDALRHVAPGLPHDRHGELAARYRHHFLSRDAQTKLYPGARELLGELASAGFLLGVATGKSRAGLDRALAQQRLASLFVVTRCADEGFPKPHPDMLEQLMGRVGVAPQSTLMIGDTTHDIELARNAGASALAVAYGAHHADGLGALAPLATVHSIAELRAWLVVNA